MVWEQLSNGEKTRLGNYFPLILKRFVDINVYPLLEALSELNVSKERAQVIIDESYPSSFCVKRAQDVAAVTFRIFRKLKVFDYPGVRQSFIDEGFPMEVAA